VSKVLKAVADQGGFKIDVVAYGDVMVDRDYIKSNVSMTYTNRYRQGGAKLTIDGSPQGFTAWRDKPYYDPVGNFKPRLFRLSGAVTPEQVFETVPSGLMPTTSSYSPIPMVKPQATS
jgi:hypothetical protein